TDRGRVVRVEDDEVEHRGLVERLVPLEERVVLRGDGHQRGPWLSRPRRALDQEVIVDVDQPGAPLGTLQSPSHAIEVVGDPGEHIYLSSTQVSLLPPPCDELTISDPSRSATRVRPPGRTRGSAPSSTNGRRSTWRAATVGSAAPSAETSVGWVDRRTVGCAMNADGFCSMRSRVSAPSR